MSDTATVSNQSHTMSDESHTPFPLGTFLVVSIALFMVTLDNLVVTTALPVIRMDLGASLESLEWTVNAYTLAYAVFLLTGAALGDRFGRRRMFGIGVTVFTVASALAALAPTHRRARRRPRASRPRRGDRHAADADAARRGAAGGTPRPCDRRVVRSRRHGRRARAGRRRRDRRRASPGTGSSGSTSRSACCWSPLSRRVLRESRGPNAHLDLRGLGLAGGGLMGLVFGIVRANELGWTSTMVLGIDAGAASRCWPRSCSGSAVRRSRCCRCASSGAARFSATNVVSFAMFFGVFGSIFFLSQYFQTVQGYSPLESGLRTLPWTAMPMIVAPIAGLLSDRIGARPLMAVGLALQSVAVMWPAIVSDVDTAYSTLVPALVMGGAGMGLVFAPSANAVLSSVRPQEAGQASGATNTIREIGGVMGIAVLASVFSHAGGYLSPQQYVDGMSAALPVGAAVLAVGALAAVLVPGRQTRPAVRAARANRSRAAAPSLR